MKYALDRLELLTTLPFPQVWLVCLQASLDCSVLMQTCVALYLTGIDYIHLSEYPQPRSEKHPADLSQLDHIHSVLNRCNVHYNKATIICPHSSHYLNLLMSI